MGIDAEMLVKIKGDKPSDEQIARWSWELVSRMGAEHFYLNEKDRTGNVRRALNLTKIDAEDWDDYGIEGEPPADGKMYIQDGPEILAEPDEWFLKTSLSGRYYGPGYERGNILIYCAIAEWIEQNIPNATVFYGGDSSGVLAEPFDEAARKELKAHLYGPEGKAYFSFMSAAISGQDAYKAKGPCALCIPGEPRFRRYGFGKNYVAVSCGGCGKCFESRYNGETWTEAQQ